MKGGFADLAAGLRAKLLDAHGNPLPTGQARKQAAVEAWMARATAGDAVLGRGDAQWAVPPAAALKSHLPDLKARGIKVYVGSGQIALADLKPNKPVVLQRRPLAQREVVIDPDGGTVS